MRCRDQTQGPQLGNWCIVIHRGRHSPFWAALGDPPLQVVVNCCFFFRRGPATQWAASGTMTSNRFQGKPPQHNRSQTLRAALRIEPRISVLAVSEVVNEQSNNLSASCLPVKGAWMEAGGYDVVVSLQSNNVVIKRKEAPGSQGWGCRQTPILVLGTICLWYTCRWKPGFKHINSAHQW